MHTNTNPKWKNERKRERDTSTPSHTENNPNKHKHHYKCHNTSFARNQTNIEDFWHFHRTLEWFRLILFAKFKRHTHTIQHKLCEIFIANWFSWRFALFLLLEILKHQTQNSHHFQLDWIVQNGQKNAAKKTQNNKIEINQRNLTNNTDKNRLFSANLR